MATIDLVLLVLLGAFIAAGFMSGLFHTLGSILGIILGYYIASQYFEPMGDFLTPIFFGNEGLSKVVAFAILFMVVSHVVGLVSWFLAKVFNILKLIPFFGIINRLGGAVLGFIEGLVAIGVILTVIQQYISNSNILESIAGSDLAQLMISTGRVLEFIFPNAFEMIEKVI